MCKRLNVLINAVLRYRGRGERAERNGLKTITGDVGRLDRSFWKGRAVNRAGLVSDRVVARAGPSSGRTRTPARPAQLVTQWSLESRTPSGRRGWWRSPTFGHIASELRKHRPVSTSRRLSDTGVCEFNSPLAHFL